MAAFTLSLLEHLALHSSTNSCLHNETSVLSDLLRLNSDLLCEFTSWRNDDGPDIVGLCALVTTDPFAELGVGCNNALDDGDKETKCFASTSFCLCDTFFLSADRTQLNIDSFLHVHAAQGLIDSPLLDVGHSLDLHLLGDGIDDVGVYQSTGRELCECSSRSLFGSGLLCFNLLCDLLPPRTVVKSGHGNIGEMG